MNELMVFEATILHCLSYTGPETSWVKNRPLEDKHWQEERYSHFFHFRERKNETARESERDGRWGVVGPRWGKEDYLVLFIGLWKIYNDNKEKKIRGRNEWMMGVLGHDSAMLRLYWAGDNQGECDELCYESPPGAGSITQPVGQQSSTLPLYCGCLHQRTQECLERYRLL